MTDNKEQITLLLGAEEMLNAGPVETARQLGTPYSTYKKWRNGSQAMPAIGLKCVELLTTLLTLQKHQGERHAE